MNKDFNYAIELSLLRQLKIKQLINQYEYETILMDINKAYHIIQIKVDER